MPRTRHQKKKSLSSRGRQEEDYEYKDEYKVPPPPPYRMPAHEQDNVAIIVPEVGGIAQVPVREISESEMLENTLRLIYDGGQALSQYNDKNAVLVLGKTGVGKSTLVNYLSGATLEYVTREEKCVYDGETIFVEKEVLEVNNPVGTVLPGHSTQSMTTIPNRWYDPKTKFTYFDCPGFDHINDVGQDIANAFYIKKLFYIQKLKLVLVVQETTLTERKGDAFIGQIKQLANLIQDFEPYKNNLSLVITKTNKDLKFVVNKLKTLLVGGSLEKGSLEANILKHFALEIGNVALFRTPQELGIIDGVDRDKILQLLSGDYAESKEANVTISQESLLAVIKLAQNVNGAVINLIKNIHDDIYVNYERELSEITNSFLDHRDKLGTFVALRLRYSSIDELIKLTELIKLAEFVTSKSDLPIKMLVEELKDEHTKLIKGDLSIEELMIELAKKNSPIEDLMKELKKLTKIGLPIEELMDGFIKLAKSGAVKEIREKIETIGELLVDKMNFDGVLRNLEYIDFFRSANPEVIRNIRPAEWGQEFEHLLSSIQQKYKDSISDLVNMIDAETRSSINQLLDKITDHCEKQGLVETLKSLQSLEDIRNAVKGVIRDSSSQDNGDLALITKNMVKFLFETFDIQADFSDIVKTNANIEVLKDIIALRMDSSFEDKNEALFKHYIDKLHMVDKHVISNMYNKLSDKLVATAKEANNRLIEEFIKKVTEYANDSSEQVESLTEVFEQHFVETERFDDLREVIKNIRELCTSKNVVGAAGVGVLDRMLSNIGEVQNLSGSAIVLSPEIWKQKIATVPEAIRDTENVLIKLKLEENINYFLDSIHRYVDIDIPKEAKFQNMKAKFEQVKQCLPKIDQLFLQYNTVDKLVPILLDISERSGMLLDPRTKQSLRDIEQSPMPLGPENQGIQKIVGLINYIKQEGKWYKSIDPIYKTLSSPDFILNPPIDKNDYRVIDEGKFNSLMQIFKIDGIPYIEHRSEQLQDLVQKTLGDAPVFTTASGKFIATGNFVKMSDVVRGAGTNQFIEVVAMDTVYFDSPNMVSKVGMTIIAPHWHIAKPVTINLNGDSGYSYGGRASDGSGNGGSGSYGTAGGPGTSAGHFYGVAANVQDLINLNIYANGGNGGSGQNGGHGASGNSGSYAGTGVTRQHSRELYSTYYYYTNGKLDYSRPTGDYIYKHTKYGSSGSSGGNGGDGGAGGHGGYHGMVKLYKNGADISGQIRKSTNSGAEGSYGSQGNGGSGGRNGDHRHDLWDTESGTWYRKSGCPSANGEWDSYNGYASSGRSGGTNYNRSSPSETASAFREKVATVKTDFARKLKNLSKRSSAEFAAKIQLPFLEEFDEMLRLSGNGTEDNLMEDFGYHQSFNKYYNTGIDAILKLRVKDLDNVKILPAKFYIENSEIHNIAEMVKEIINIFAVDLSSKILVPYNIGNKHWIGIVVEEQEGKVGITYLDSENNEIPALLTESLHNIFGLLDLDVKFAQLMLEDQKSGNCGSEMIENFMWYLTGERVSQEEAVRLHSQLVEEELLSLSNVANVSVDEVINFDIIADKEFIVAINGDATEVESLVT